MKYAFTFRIKLKSMWESDKCFKNKPGQSLFVSIDFCEMIFSWNVGHIYKKIYIEMDESSNFLHNFLSQFRTQFVFSQALQSYCTNSSQKKPQIMKTFRLLNVNNGTEIYKVCVEHQTVELRHFTMTYFSEEAKKTPHIRELKKNVLKSVIFQRFFFLSHQKKRFG